MRRENPRASPSPTTSPICAQLTEQPPKESKRKSASNSNPISQTKWESLQSSQAPKQRTTSSNNNRKTKQISFLRLRSAAHEADRSAGCQSAFLCGDGNVQLGAQFSMRFVRWHAEPTSINMATRL